MLQPHRPPPKLELRDLQNLFGGSLIWIALAMLLVVVVLVATVRVGRVTGEEVGILLNKMNGRTTVIPQSGVRIYNGITHRFYAIDKTLQSLEMTDVTDRGDRAGRDDLKIKTEDGSDVYVDLKVQYRINADMADAVIASSGPGDLYKQKWARDYVRSIARNHLGNLTTEQFYDASKRDARLAMALQQANLRLSEVGIIIDSIVIPKKPRFYAEYEAMIKKKKLADQAVLEEQSKAQAAKQKQQTLLVTESNVKNVAVEEFRGEMEQKIIAAKAESERTKLQAGAYYEKTTIGAAALLYEKTKTATGILARKKAEAEGIEALKRALEGEGGRNMVKLEYARQLANATFTGQPFTVESRTERFEHSAAAAVRRAARTPATP